MPTVIKVALHACMIMLSIMQPRLISATTCMIILSNMHILSSLMDPNMWATAFCRTEEAGETPSIIKSGRIQPMVVVIESISDVFGARRT